MNKKLILAAAIAMGLAGCGKDKTVSDPGPQFKLSAQDIKLSGAESSVVNLTRSNLIEGPVLEIHYSDPQSIQSIEKTLVCGPLTLQGKKVNNPDSAGFYFKISETEFPQLSSLPRKASCKLTVKLENKVGSTVKKESSLKLIFDSNPNISVKRTTAGNGLIGRNDNGFIELDVQEFKNTFNYPVRVSYIPNAVHCIASPAYRDTQGTQPYFCALNKQPLKITSFEISGAYENLTGDLTSRAEFTIPPGQVVKVKGLGRMNSPESKSSGIISRPIPLAGAHLTQCLDPYKFPISSLANDFQSSSEDFADPSLIKFAPNSIFIHNPAIDCAPFFE